MTTLLAIILIILIILILVLIYLNYKNSISNFSQNDNSIKADISKLQSTTDFNSNFSKDELEKLKKYINDLNQKIEQTTKMEMNFQENVQSKVDGLINVFNNNKEKGNLGEYMLKEILLDSFPKTKDYFLEQTKQDSGKRADFSIRFTKESKFIAIDSKFPTKSFKEMKKSINDKNELNKNISQFKTDIKNKIKETSKYINSNDYTDYAIMFLPSNAIYNQATQYDEIIKEAEKQRVFITSPSNINLYLMTLKDTVKRENFAKDSQKIIDLISKITDEINSFETLHENLIEKLSKFWTDIEPNNPKGVLYQIKTKMSKINSDMNKLNNFKKDDDIEEN